MERTQNLLRSNQAKVIAVAYLLLIIASAVLDGLSPDKQSAGAYILKYVVLVVYALFQVYIVNCLVYGGCTVYATIVAVVTFVLALLVVFFPYLLAMNDRPQKV